jgi:hypothetical protein
MGAPVNTITALTNGSENLIALQTEISRTLVAVERAQMHAE